MFRVYDIDKIETVLEVKLFPDVIDYLEGKECNFKGRRCGKTTAYIIKRALNVKHPISLRGLRLGQHNDELHDSNYNNWFTHEFMYIRDKLKKGGFEVVEIKK